MFYLLKFGNTWEISQNVKLPIFHFIQAKVTQLKLSNKKIMPFILIKIPILQSNTNFMIVGIVFSYLEDEVNIKYFSTFLTTKV